MAIAALGVAGCGGSSSPSTQATSTPAAAPTKAAFILQADAICKAHKTQEAPLESQLGALSNESDATAESTGPPLMNKLATMAQSDLAQLQALPEPTGDQAVLTSAWNAQAKTIADLQNAAAALGNADLQGFQSDIAAGNTASAAASGIAQGYGFKVCGSSQ